jgi:hemerythrin
MAVEIGKGDDILGEALSELIEFTKIHFATEVRLMKIHDYPDLASHEKEHDELKNHVFELNRRFNDGQSILTTTVENFLTGELLNHFQKTDMKFGSFINSTGMI